MNKKITISVVLTVRNEEKIIADCLNSVKWADEIIVVDDSSTDNTNKIAKKYTDKVYLHKSVGYVEPVRNFAVAKATGDWILVLDADERIYVSLAHRLREIANTEKEAAGIEIPRKNIIFGKWIKHTGWWPDYQMRFFKKGKLIWSERIHEQPESAGKSIQLESKEELSIIHFHYQKISEFLEKMNRYTDIEAKAYIKSDENFNWTDMVTKPFDEFLSRFFARSGYRDGLHGLVLAILQAISMFVVTLKVWEQKGFQEVEAKILLKQTEKEVRNMKKEILYWFTLEKVNDIKNPIKKNAYILLKKVIY